MNGCWTNLGGIMALHNESGRPVGLLMPMDKQIHDRITKSLYEAPMRFSVEGCKVLIPP